MAQARRYKSTCNSSLLYIEPVVSTKSGSLTHQQIGLRGTSISNLITGAPIVVRGDKAKGFSYSSGLSASWTGGAGGGAGNAADCKDSFRLPSKTEFIDLCRRQEKHIAAAPEDRFWMFLTETSERMWGHLQKGLHGRTEMT